MIKQIKITNKNNAQAVLDVQLPAYKVEAEIIGSFDIPALKDTIATLQNSEETFFGYYENTQLCGVISIKLIQNEIDIHRLIVHPNYFRKGIAQSLLNFIETKFPTSTAITVATASNNSPAITFYTKNGFHQTQQIKINPELSLTHFKK